MKRARFYSSICSPRIPLEFVSQVWISRSEDILRNQSVPDLAASPMAECGLRCTFGQPSQERVSSAQRIVPKAVKKTQSSECPCIPTQQHNFGQYLSARSNHDL